MKSNLLFTPIIFIFFLFHQSNTFANECIYAYNFNQDSKDEVYAEIIQFLELSDNVDSAQWTVEMRWIRHKLDSLLGIMPFSESIDPQEESLVESCDGGPFRMEGTHYGETCFIEFEWDDLLLGILQYSTYYLNLDIQSGIMEQSIIEDATSFGNGTLPTTSLDIPYLGKHLFAINTRCATNQSSYTIIIVEKIITTTEFFCELAPDPEPETRLKETDHKNTLTVLPNLITEANAQITFKVSDTEKTSIRLFDSSTGIQIKELLSNQRLSEGEYTIKLDLGNLAPGIYFVILLSGQERIIKKLVKT